MSSRLTPCQAANAPVISSSLFYSHLQFWLQPSTFNLQPSASYSPFKATGAQAAAGETAGKMSERSEFFSGRQAQSERRGPAPVRVALSGCPFGPAFWTSKRPGGMAGRNPPVLPLFSFSLCASASQRLCVKAYEVLILTPDS
jgi:hypothetical protein